jgi:hypothetical protein
VSVQLAEILTLVGWLDDAPGVDTPRERFRRFVKEHVATPDALRDLLQQSLERLGAQFARARQDLVLSIGPFLGLDVTFGSYDHRRGPARLAGHWRSRHAAHLAIDICGEQSDDADLETFARTVATLDAAVGTDSDEHWLGICVTTPFFAARHRLAGLARQCEPRIQVVSVESLLWLADMRSAGRLTTDVIVRLLTTEGECDFLVEVMRGLVAGGTSAGHEPPAADPPRLKDERSPDIARAAPDSPERSTGFWIASMASDSASDAQHIFDAVVVRRQLIGVASGDSAAALVRSGDRVCFVSVGIGVLGCAEVDGPISDPSQVLRAGARYSAVFSLREIGVFDPPRHLADGSVPERMDSASKDDDRTGGVWLCPVSRVEFVAMTGRMELVIGAKGPDEEALRVRA